MSCAPSGSGDPARGAAPLPAGAPRAPRPSSRSSTAGAQFASTCRAEIRCAVGERHLGVNAIARDGHDLGVGPQRRPGAPRGGREAIRHRAHPADGHVPAAGSVADHVVEEAPVLTQLRIVGGRERSDEPVGQGNPAGLVVAHRALKQLGQRRLEQRAPRRLADEPAHLLTGAQRLGERWEYPLGDARQRAERRRAGGSSSQLHADAELGEQSRRKQADEVGKPR